MSARWGPTILRTRRTIAELSSLYKSVLGLTELVLLYMFVFKHAFRADQLLAVQFREDMTRLTEHVGRRAPGGRQTLLVSATLTPNVRHSQ